MAEYQRAIKEDPANAAEAHYRIGVLSNKLGNTEGAVQEFQAALQLNPTHAEARAAVAAFYVNRGAAARQQHRLDEALRELQEAVKVDPGSSTTHLELGQAYEESGRLAEAVQEYQAAVNADAKNLTAQLRLGQGYNAQQQYEAAAAAFRAVLEGNPDRAEAYAGLGAAYFHQDQRDDHEPEVGEQGELSAVGERAGYRVRPRHEFQAAEQHGADDRDAGRGSDAL